MARIDSDLFRKMMGKSRLSRAVVYKRITDKANATFLPRHLAAVALAAEMGVATHRYATDEERAQIRGAASSARSIDSRPVEFPAQLRVAKATTSARSVAKARTSKRPTNSVFVVHGRNNKLRAAMFDFLRAVGLNPIEWNKAIALTKTGSPVIADIIDKAFRTAQAIVVLLTPDDEARLLPEFHKQHEDPWETDLTKQARPNVLFEAGLAFGRNEKGTILVQVGRLRPFSDVAGKHIVYLSNSPESRTELVTKLKNAGCTADTTGTDWLRAGDFTIEEAKQKKRRA